MADTVLDGTPIAADQALSLLTSSDEELLSLVASGSRIRRRHFGMRVKLNYLVDLKSGLCPENCSYCSQAPGATVPILEDGQAATLRDAGVDTYHDNDNTAESFHDTIEQTRTCADRTATIERARTSGLSPRSGLIVGMGESGEQVIEALFALKELD